MLLRIIDNRKAVCLDDAQRIVLRDLLIAQVGQVALAQHAALPADDVRDHVGKQAQGVIGGKDRDAQKISKHDQDE